MPDSSFDIVSEVDLQEVRNAATQAEKEIANRYDLKRVNAKLRIEGEALELEAADEFSVGQARDILESRLSKRGCT
jgi:cyclic-di-GMP-binding protein